MQFLEIFKDQGLGFVCFFHDELLGYF